ncbi:auxin-responsive protein IAA18-like [Iris pallida]|uniref:Auxin-responsive protein n=1 Tax=Iris pallida TaxID=29817 RepID=A0AAX6HE85_IRIPA|nr:auxin-responsive protein IAA18-like [Iris pallida]
MEDEEYDCPQLLDLIPNEREIWKPRPAADHHGSTGISSTIQEKQLELRLAPPSPGVVVVKEELEGEPTNHSSSSSKPGAKRAFLATVLTSSSSSTTTHVLLEEELLQRRGAVMLGKELADKKPCCSPPPPAAPPPHACAAVAHSSPQTRAVVGWPPVRSFRKNIASTSNKPTVESQKRGSEKATKPDNGGRGSFVKINMEGVPIGRKVDLKAYDNYDRLSLAVEELFRGLLEAQRDPKAVGGQKHTEKSQALKGLVDGTGEYTLVYEDDEGDKLLVGDVPWEMFVAQAKRLRVLKTSELSLLHLGNKKRTAKGC